MYVYRPRLINFFGTTLDMRFGSATRVEEKRQMRQVVGL